MNSHMQNKGSLSEGSKEISVFQIAFGSIQVYLHTKSTRLYLNIELIKENFCKQLFYVSSIYFLRSL